MTPVRPQCTCRSRTNEYGLHDYCEFCHKQDAVMGLTGHASQRKMRPSKQTEKEWAISGLPTGTLVLYNGMFMPVQDGTVVLDFPPSFNDLVMVIRPVDFLLRFLI